ncbi:MaoC family dehydratase N-terminal domain-containing protein [Tateyamaria sp. SN3-11]|uniref:FAS1-like dehydratase domain-containing protein n=1 Tax=Tateyamaria sp. SN3-11 TaxID=3092147 RepID=UPI0039EB89A5
MDQVNTAAWIGRTICDQGGIDALSAAKLHATIGHPHMAHPAPGDLLPALWHWAAFPPLTHVTQLGPDGHPGPGELMPPLRLPRRMWAGGALRFHAPLRVGDTLSRQVSLRSAVEKETASGPMALVTLDHAITGPRGLAIEERQDIVYLPMPDTFTPPKKRQMPAPGAETVAMSMPLLLRYSAVTFNAHRIHYDLDYTRTVEKYPDLVVHGPLQASLLMRHAITQKGRPPVYFDFRAVHPMFASGDLDICTTEEDGIMSLYSGQDGHQGMQATAMWEDTQ